MRFGIYYSGGLDSTFKARAIGSVADLIDAVPRDDYPAYAEAQVRELIARYRPSVLWNDIAWPTAGTALWSLFAHYYARLVAARTKVARRAIDAAARRQLRRGAGVIPPAPPHCDVRTPEYVVFDEIQQKPWECVRGMDRSFGYNAASGPEHFLTRDELLWMVTDIVAKGGNLLLNVGPRGFDAQIPEEQLTRLEWLGAWFRPHADALVATRPWVTPGADEPDGQRVRYTERDGTVYAFTHEAADTITLPDVAPTPTTAVTTIEGEPLAWQDTPAGLVIHEPRAHANPTPVVVALRHVAARHAR
jgi:alpha-L-fucosidase